MTPERSGEGASLRTVAVQWTRIGITGFGGPPAHITLLRALVVDRRRWMDEQEFEHATAACGLLPGPASTQLAIVCAYRVAGPRGAIVGGLGFILPAVVLILALSMLFLSGTPPKWVLGAGAGAGATVAAVAVHAARELLGPSYERVRDVAADRTAWLGYLVAGALAALLIGPYLVLVLLGSGALELLRRRRPSLPLGLWWTPWGSLAATLSTGGIGALAWLALKVGALSYGGGFVIIPLMQHDAVDTYHWMSDGQFLNAVALGQITPGPVVATVAALGYAAHGFVGGVLASALAFLPSFAFILIAGQRFERLRANAGARAFLDGAGPAAIGAILGAGVTLAFALSEPWQWVLLAAAAVALLLLDQGVVPTLVGAGVIGVILALNAAPLP